MISKGILSHQNNAPVHSSVVAKALVVPRSPMGLVLVNMMGMELVGSHSPELLPLQPLMNAKLHWSIVLVKQDTFSDHSTSI